MKSFQKKLLTELVDEYVKKHWEDIYFMKLLNELSVFGVKNTDRVMAFGMALIHNMDAERKVRNVKDDENVEDMEGLPEFERNENGGIIVSGTREKSFFDNSTNSPTFDYDFDID